MRKHIPLFMQQDYPNFEIVLVNDGSTDNTGDVLQAWGNSLQHIHIKPADKIGSGKKYALIQGISVAQGDIVLLTDADCYPQSKTWIKSMVEAFQQQTDIVLGVGLYEKENTLLNSLIEYETAQTALQYISFAKMRSSYMSVGRNVAYKKDLLKQLTWKVADYTIASGDDDLAIQQLSNNTNTSVCVYQNANMLSIPKKRWSEWFLQKSRHVQSSVFYKLHQKVALGLYALSKIGFYLFAFILLFCSVKTSISILLLYWIFLGLIFSILNHKKSWIPRWYLIPINDLLLLVSWVIVGIRGLIFSPKKWK